MEEAQAQAANTLPGILQSSVVMIFFFTLSKEREPLKCFCILSQGGRDFLYIGVTGVIDVPFRGTLSHLFTF
jgi:hypothetical protein